MSAADNKAVVRHLHEALNRGDLGVLDQHPGLAEIKPTLQRAYTASPDHQTTIEEMVAEGDWVAVRLINRGTHTGSAFGEAPTGNALSYEVLTFYRIEDGRVVRQHSQADLLSLMHQIGVTSLPGR